MKLVRYRLSVPNGYWVRGQLHYQRYGVVPADSAVGWELAPLPGLHKETLSMALAELRYRRGDWQSSAFPSVAFCGLDEKLGDVADHNAQAYCLDWHGGHASPVKIKVRPGMSYLADHYRQQAERADRQLILDAGATLSFEEAAYWVKALGDRLEYFEEPCLSHCDSLRLNAPIGWDEHMTRLIPSELARANVWVIKPITEGYLSVLESYAERAVAADSQLVLSGAYESARGLKLMARLAAYLQLTTAIGARLPMDWHYEEISFGTL